MLKVGDKVKLNNSSCSYLFDCYGIGKNDIGTIVEAKYQISLGIKFEKLDHPVYQMSTQLTLVSLGSLLQNANLSRLSIALGKHRSYLNKMIQQGVSNKTYNKIKDKLTIDWNSDKPLYVNDRKHVPFTIKPISCKQEKHKEWLQSLMMSGCVKL